MSMLIEDEDTNITLDGKVVVEYYTSNAMDFRRFVSELRQVAHAHGIDQIKTILGHVSTIQEYIDYEEPIVRKSIYDRMTDN